MSPFRFLHLLLILLFSYASANTYHSLLRMVPDDRVFSGSAGFRGAADGIFCDSWRLSVETNNAGHWRIIPENCLGMVEEYMNGDRYSSDSDVVGADSLSFAMTVQIEGDGKDIWIFDIDETLLSNLPYYVVHGYGSEVFNETSFDEWVDLAKAPALPTSLWLYEELLGLGFQIVLLTGRSEFQRSATEKNLLFAGYHSWERLILRQTADIGKSAVVYKSERRAELEAQGFRIHGNSGDQWSDLLGSPMTKRSFKLPNPMYCVE
ncbi:acid phosphatase 1-like [Zingiber officinale]|uniref:acid phosphatase 1-like n=1 Tax=Zingiber officinale TaxID=94328 RepID=UPI001C4D8F9E|nr:acid phosphatase 1-like [Zingiber officinale]